METTLPTPAPPLPSLVLVPVFVGELNGRTQLLVDARELHTFLKVGRDFSNWIKDRLNEYGFSEGEDYSPILANRSDGLPGKPRTDYHLCLDAAKELAMVERNEQGRMVRRYFIECERRLLQAPPAAPVDIAPLLEKFKDELMLIFIEREGCFPRRRGARQVPNQRDLFISAERLDADTDHAKRTVTAYILKMSRRLIVSSAIRRFNKANEKGTLPAGVARAAKLALSDMRGRGPKPNLSLSTFYRWKRLYFPDNTPAKP